MVFRLLVWVYTDRQRMSDSENEREEEELDLSNVRMRLLIAALQRALQAKDKLC